MGSLVSRVPVASTGFDVGSDADAGLPRLRGVMAGFDLNLFKALANAPLAYRGFCELSIHLFLGNFEARAREALILRVTSVARSTYEWSGHVVAARAAGLDDNTIRGIRDGSYVGLSAREAAAARFGEAVETSSVDDVIWQETSVYFDDAQMVELTVLAGFYGLACRTALALGVELEPEWSDVEEL